MAKILHAALWIGVIGSIYIIWNRIYVTFGLKSMDAYIVRLYGHG